MTLILFNDEIDRLLTMEATIAAMEIAFKDLASAKAVNRPRSHTYAPVGENTFYCFKTMDGGIPSLGVHALRLTSDILADTVVEEGRRFEKLALGKDKKRLGLVMLFSIETAELLAIMQDDHLQRMRVGATSALAAQALARADARVVGMFGAGWQAGTQLLGLKRLMDISEAKVFSPTEERRISFCEEWSEKLGIDVRPSDNPKQVVEGSDIVVAATNSLDPVFSGDWLEPGQHVNSVQAAELDARTLERAHLIAIRAREQSTFWAMDERRPGQMVAHQTYDPQIEAKLQELGRVMTGQAGGRTADNQITVFGGSGTGPSSGLGIQFAAVGAVIYEAARKKGIGREVPGDWFVSGYLKG